MIVERWNGVPFEEPYKKVRDMVRFLRDAFSGDKVSKTYDTFEIQGFRLGVRPEQKPPILVAALREGMLRLAAREADGAIINWLGPDDVPKVMSVLADAAGGEAREVVARIFVCPSENTEAVRAGARYAIAAYMNVPVYAAFQEWIGRAAAAPDQRKLAVVFDELEESLPAVLASRKEEGREFLAFLERQSRRVDLTKAQQNQLRALRDDLAESLGGKEERGH